MPNDAKLGLLVGVAGVLVAAVTFAPQGPPGTTVAAGPGGGPVAMRSAAGPTRLPPARVSVPAQTPSMPTAYAGARTKPEVDGTVTGRKNVR